MKQSICLKCNDDEIYGTKITKKYCDNCIKISERAGAKKRKRKSRLIRRWNRRKELDTHFKNLNPSGENLIPINFDSISNIKSSSYVQHFGKEWARVLIRYSKQDEVIRHLKSEYKKWSQETNQQDTKAFYSFLRTTKNSFKALVSDDDLRDAIGIKKKRYSNDEYNKEFHRVIEMFEHLPTSTEFRANSRINLYSYARKYNLQGEVYISLLQFYNIPKIKIDSLIDRQFSLKSNRATEQLTGVNKITEEELINDFKEVIDNYLEKYGAVPSFLEFDRQSKYGKNTLLTRLNMKYSEMIQKLGYEYDQHGSSTEKIVLEDIKSILNTDYKPQATFDWLKGNSNKKLLCDGYYSSYNLIVEYDGQQHFMPVEVFGGYDNLITTQERDQIKNTLIPQNNLTLLRIAFDEPYYDTDFLRFRLIEKEIYPPVCTVINDSFNNKLITS